jgi:ATP-binding cassette, subfamily D (ALD), peroxisomal long-chain fatty acid import protein
LDLTRILESVRLGYLEEREGGWDVKKEWKDVLSGGEKQRMIIARLLYHDPKYAVLDEPTSAVSTDVEGLLYETAKAQGITIITISSRAQLKRYHTFQLELGTEDGKGWEFDRIGGDRERVHVRKELEELRRKVERVEALKKRLEVVKTELGEAGLVGGKIEA